MTIRRALPSDFNKWYGTAIEMYVLEREGELLAIGGLYRHRDGRTFAVLDVSDDASGLRLVWWVRRWLRQHDRPIYAACWGWRYTQAPRLLKILGFVATDEVQPDRKRVWVLQ
jgi:hypothetical protein